MKNGVIMAKRVARMGVFVALAMIFSYIEALIPINLGIPGVKLGLANIVIVIGLYLFSTEDTFVISLVRIILSGLLFGNGLSLIYSLAGGILSFFVMVLLKKTSQFTVIGVSVAGGVFHNVGQIFVAVFILQNMTVIGYLPILMIAGIITGTLMGLLSLRVIRIMEKK